MKRVTGNDMNSTPFIQSHIEDHIAVVRLDNPPMNVVSRQMTRQMNALLRSLGDDPTIRAIVLTGTGDGAFCAGSDISEMPAMQARGSVVDDKVAYENETYELLADLPQPTIAAVRGVALGGGLELALCCDLIVAESGCQLGLPEIQLGLIPSDGGALRAIRRIGQGRTAELVLLGEPISAETALSWGLINEVVSLGKAIDRALEVAKKLADKSPDALRLNKQALALAFGPDPHRPARDAVPLFAESFSSSGGREGVRAFLAKEAPRFND